MRGVVCVCVWGGCNYMCAYSGCSILCVCSACLAYVYVVCVCSFVCTCICREGDNEPFSLKQI